VTLGAVTVRTTFAADGVRAATRAAAGGIAVVDGDRTEESVGENGTLLVGRDSALALGTLRARLSILCRET
jgi:hypothetical protein